MDYACDYNKYTGSLVKTTMTLVGIIYSLIVVWTMYYIVSESHDADQSARMQAGCLSHVNMACHTWPGHAVLEHLCLYSQ